MYVFDVLFRFIKFYHYLLNCFLSLFLFVHYYILNCCYSEYIDQNKKRKKPSTRVFYMFYEAETS